MSEDAPRTTPLWRLSEHHQDPLLFPLEVHERYEAGQPLAARELLASVARKETDATRKQRQLEALDDPYLWLEPVTGAPPLLTFNGIGFTLYGRHKPARSGHYVATHWFTIVFVPIFPIGAYVVRDAPEGGWHFFGRAPLPPGARRVQLGVMGLAAAGLFAFVGNLWWASRHVDVVAYNGHDRPLEVHVGDQVRTVGAHAAVTFAGLPIGPTPLSAVLDGRTIDALEADLTGHHRDTVLYDVNGRGALTLEWVRYGFGDPPDGRLLPPDRLQFLPAVDYVFTEPPDQKSVPKGGYVDDSVLGSLDDELSFDAIADLVLQQHGVDAAIEVFLAEAEVRPDAPDVANVAWALFFLDPAVRTRFADRWRDEAPGSVEAHRFWQEAHDGEEGVADAYRALLDAHPDSPLHLYLYARVLPDGEPEAEALLRRAMAIDPRFERAWGALAHHLACADRFEEAADAYAQYAGFGNDQAAETLPDRVRLARLLGRPTGPLFDEVATQTGNPTSLRLLRAMVDVADHPDQLEAQLAALPFDPGGLPAELVPVLRARLELMLCVAADDAACARPRMEALAGSPVESEAALAAIWLAGGRDDAERPLPPEGVSDADVRVPVIAAYAVGNGLPGASTWRDRARSGPYRELGDLLDPAFDPGDVEAVRAKLAGRPPRDRALGFAMAALLTRGPARNALRDEAERYAMPSEIPRFR